MMSYATLEDLLNRTPSGEILQLAPLNEDDEQIDVAKVEVALADAAETINTYIGTRHALPLSVVPEILRRTNCVLARYFLYRGVKPDDVKDEYEKAVSYLRDVAKGVVILEDSSTGAEPKQAGDVVFKGSSPRLFSHRNLEGF